MQTADTINAITQLQQNKKYKAKRQQLIEAGKIWHIYPNGEMDNVLLEGTATQCRSYINKNYKRAFKTGKIRLARVIYEPTN